MHVKIIHEKANIHLEDAISKFIRERNFDGECLTSFNVLITELQIKTIHSQPWLAQVSSEMQQCIKLVFYFFY